MGDRSLAHRLKKWAVEEFRQPPRDLPSDTYFKTLSLGQGAAIWKYVTQHVFHQRNVTVIRGNLQWYKAMQGLEVRRGEGQSELARRRALQREREELWAELSQLDSQISLAQTELANHEKSASGSWSRGTEQRQRAVLLRAMGLRCAQERLSLSGDRQSVRQHCQGLGQLARKAQVELAFGNPFDSSTDSQGSAGPEAQVLREVREVCENRLHFFQSLLESELKTVPPTGAHVSQEEHSAVFQRWLSSVQDLLTRHPPGHVLSALQYLASRQQGTLQDRLAELDVSRDVAALRFRYDSERLQDESGQQQQLEEEALPSVKWLLQDGWREVEHCSVRRAAARAAARELGAQLARSREAALSVLEGRCQADAFARTVFELELQLAVLCALQESMQAQCAALAQSARAQQHTLLTLRSKWQNILDFRQLVDRKQEQIRTLIKANSTAKTDITRAHAAISQFVQAQLLGHAGTLRAAVEVLHGGVSREAQQAAGVSLAELNRRVLDGEQRVPVHRLSIWRLHCPAPFEEDAILGVCRCLDFPLYRAPEQLVPQTVSLRLEQRVLCRLLQLHTSSLQHLQQQRALLPSPDLQAVLQHVQKEDGELVSSLLPTVSRLSQQSAQGLRYGAEVKRAINHWWEQPAQFALPELRRGGLTLQQWLERWRLAANMLE
ncbi:HAUS augmin-like complex subunit 5 [Amia ocellicauda]|uniref:HAUS augmin-like complex subunit 5 n=1 Tax=Amia ocellicauda TaxID=2972642 RepID=UPI0034645182